MTPAVRAIKPGPDPTSRRTPSVVRTFPLKLNTLDEGAAAGDGFADNQRVHLARAFIRIDGFGVGDETTDMVLQQDAVAVEQFPRIADGLAPPQGDDRLSQQPNQQRRV